MNLLREVKEKVERPFSEKLLEAQGLIAHNLMVFKGKTAVAFSGGKDSEVVLYLTLQLNPDVPVVFNNTGVEYPETVKFVAMLAGQWSLNLIVTHPEKSFWDCIEQYGFADGSKARASGSKAPCCYWLKEKPMLMAIRQNGWLGYFSGETASESWRRMIWARSRGTCFHLKKEKVCKIKPLLWWTEDEVWNFIRDNNLPINEAYSKGAKRVGCMPCTAFKHWEVQMQKVNPKLYRLIKLRKDNQYVMELL